MNARNFRSGFLPAICLCLSQGLHALENTQININPDESITLNYVGGDTRLGIGITDNGDPLGEFYKLFAADNDSNWITQAWLSDDAGGLKFSYLWLNNGDTIETANDNSRIGKAFFAVDQSAGSHQKATAGVGFEQQNYFLSGYLSYGLSNAKLINERTTSSVETLFGVENGRNYAQTQTTNTLISLFEQAYDYGVGFRIGKFFDGALFRLHTGLDYEKGDFSSSQATLTFGAEKFFKNSGHSLELTAEWFNKSGDFTQNDDNARAQLIWHYEFGEIYRPSHNYENEKIEHPAETIDAITERKLIQHDIKLEQSALFEFDRYAITPQIANLLTSLVESMGKTGIIGGIQVVGHTCDLGPEAYNQTLSERRADAIKGFLVNAGIKTSSITAQGRGESQPAVPNTNDSNREKNRRVELRFVTQKEEWETVTLTPTNTIEPRIEWKKTLIKSPPAWVQRALRNPIRHKRNVDTYRFQKTETEQRLGDRVFLNQLPLAEDDQVQLSQDSMATVIDVLANDSDPDNDTLEIISVTSASNGLIENLGSALTYQPNANFTGVDQFSYTISDGVDGQATAQVTVTVINGPPTVSDDTASTPKSTSITIDVLANDQDPEGEILTIIATTDPEFGSIETLAESIVYTPENGFSGNDFFSYTVSDPQGNEATGIVTIQVVNGSPIAVADVAAVVAGSSVFIDVLLNDSDPDGDPLSIVSIGTVASGTAVIENNGITYVADADAANTDLILQYTITDGDDTAQSTVNISIRSSNQAPVAVADAFNVPKNDTAILDVLENDFDPDGDEIRVIDASDSLTGMGHTEINSDGTITYIPMAGWWGQDQFNYTIEDELGAQSTTIVTVRVFNN